MAPACAVCYPEILFKKKKIIIIIIRKMLQEETPRG